MNAQTRKGLVAGPAGELEIAQDAALGPSRGVCVISHPHPLFGGSLDNKVVQTLARAFNQCGWDTVRYNFRGVGASQGRYDEGRGELQDLLAVVAQLQARGPLSLAGFSFGAFITSRACAHLMSQRSIDRVVLVGTAASRFDVPPIAPDLHDRTLVIHGQADDTVPLDAVLDWARPQVLPVLVIPGGGHFFHGQLPLLKSLVVRHLSA
ncbi:MAG: alpha/beta fold hydrolase [Betaproteobacteria bacterium]|nr:alpha/beta fold hydrolase [Betaproteobacteria bacterium]